MAKKTVTTTEYTDDLDGSTAAQTVQFGWDGTHYEIDLSRANNRAFERTMKPYLEAGRIVRATRGRTSTRGKSSVKHDLSAVRAWAKSNGYDVSDRGRVARSVVEAYGAVH